MGALRKQYRITKRYVCGPEVVGYHMEDIDSHIGRRYNRDEVAYLVGRGQVINCEGQIYKDKVLFRGVGCKLDELESISVNNAEI